MFIFFCKTHSSKKIAAWIENITKINNQLTKITKEIDN